MTWKEEYGHLPVNLVNQRLKQPLRCWCLFSFALNKSPLYRLHQGPFGFFRFCGFRNHLNVSNVMCHTSL